MSENKKTHPESPEWGLTTKLVVGLSLAAIGLWLLVQFQNFLGPLITAFILAFLIQPLARFLEEKIKLPWRLSVTIIFLLIVIILAGLLTWGGLALVEQIQTLIRFIDRNLDQLPDLVADITNQTYQIGPFELTPFGFNWDELTNEIVRLIQPMLGRLGTLASSLAAGAASIISWGILIILVAYFLLAESEGIPSRVLNINIPGYQKDLDRFGTEITRIWQGFIRGEILVVIFAQIIYTVMLAALGVQFFFGLATIAAIGQLIPYLGAWITWISFGLVAVFQTNIPFNLPPGIYMVIVLAVSLLANSIIDQIIRTKVMADSLKVHPALVLIGAFIGVQLLGFIGIVIAAPIMATLKLLLNYTIKKLQDQDPWEELDLQEPVKITGGIKWMLTWWKKIKNWIKNKFKKQGTEPSGAEDKASN